MQAVGGVCRAANNGACSEGMNVAGCEMIMGSVFELNAKICFVQIRTWERQAVKIIQGASLLAPPGHSQQYYSALFKPSPA